MKKDLELSKFALYPGKCCLVVSAQDTDGSSCRSFVIPESCGVQSGEEAATEDIMTGITNGG